MEALLHSPTFFSTSYLIVLHNTMSSAYNMHHRDRSFIPWANTAMIMVKRKILGVALRPLGSCPLILYCFLPGFSFLHTYPVQYPYILLKVSNKVWNISLLECPIKCHFSLSQKLQYIMLNCSLISICNCSPCACLVMFRMSVFVFQSAIRCCLFASHRMAAIKSSSRKQGKYEFITGCPGPRL